MSRLREIILSVLCLHYHTVSAVTQSLHLDQTPDFHQRCIDMTGSRAFDPQQESSLSIKFQTGSSGVVSVVMFELGDEHLGGIRRPGTKEKEVLCTPRNIKQGLCTASQANEFLISDVARFKAKYPLITRAINLTNPIGLLYPVKGPGFYCAATVHASGKTFSATMLAEERGRSVPAFRAGLLPVYYILTPVWLVSAAVWMAWYWELLQSLHQERLKHHSYDSTMRWLVPFSAVQVATRLIGLRSNTGYQNIFTMTWYILNLAQNMVVIWHTHRIATDGRATTYSLFVSYAAAVSLLIVTAAASFVDYHADATSQSPAYINSVCGLTLALYLGICTLWLRRPFVQVQVVSDLPSRSEPTAKKDAREITALSTGFLGIAALFLVLAVVDVWAKVSGGSLLEFAHRFWRQRFWILDAPREFIFLLWLTILALHSLYCVNFGRNKQPINEDHYKTEEEREWLRDSVDDTTDAERESEGKVAG
ncbi:hypothetical protein F4859DRAFT_524892 [Xylaria cf. heliscus]|nr:hypothetical protein F4859DRAFT_524892 [Xylaria cf. heliscus]